MSKENMSGSKTPKILGAVIAIAAVVGVVGWFANREMKETTEVSTANTEKNPKVDETVTETETAEEEAEEAAAAVAATTITAPSTNAQPASTTTSPTPETTSPYKDGTYSATGSYQSPAGQETVTISLTVKTGMITAASFTGNATNPASKNWQNAFNQGYTSLVVGKPIDGLNLTIVNGSSLTPKGFMDAVADIKTEAGA